MPLAGNYEWLNQNALRNYPVREDARLIPHDASGVLIQDIRVPNFIVVDLVLTVSSELMPRVYLAKLAHVGDLLTFVFFDQDDAQVTAASCLVSTHLKNQAYELVGSGIYSDARGKVVVGDLTRLKQELPEGLFEFTLATAELESTTIRPSQRGVRSLRINNQGADSDYIYGHVKLVAGSNVRLSYVAADNAIRVDAIEGEGFNQTCPCTTGTGGCIKTINGVAVEDAILQGDGDCVEVAVSGNVITISEKCCTPCCTCPELEALVENLRILDKTLTTMEDYAQKLNERIQTFVTNYILTIK